MRLRFITWKSKTLIKTFVIHNFVCANLYSRNRGNNDTFYQFTDIVVHRNSCTVSTKYMLYSLILSTNCPRRASFHCHQPAVLWSPTAWKMLQSRASDWLYFGLMGSPIYTRLLTLQSLSIINTLRPHIYLQLKSGLYILYKILSWWGVGV